MFFSRLNVAVNYTVLSVSSLTLKSYLLSEVTGATMMMYLKCYRVTRERAGQAPLAGLLSPVCGLHSPVTFCPREQ